MAQTNQHSMNNKLGACGRCGPKVLVVFLQAYAITESGSRVTAANTALLLEIARR